MLSEQSRHQLESAAACAGREQSRRLYEVSTWKHNDGTRSMTWNALPNAWVDACQHAPVSRSDTSERSGVSEFCTVEKLVKVLYTEPCLSAVLTSLL